MQAMKTPDRERLHKQANARNKARKQVPTVQQRLDELAQGSQAAGAPRDASQAQGAQAVLSGAPVKGVQIVYPGSAGEAYWCKWEGRYGIAVINI